MAFKTTYNADRVAFLATEILRHKQLYYAGKPEISDAMYDLLEEELSTLAPEHPVLAVVGQPNLVSNNPKIVHDRPMLSLNKTYDLKELISWAAGRDVVGTLKVDGTSISLIYQGGKLVLAKTRGNGREGEDVTAKLKWVTDAVPQLSTGVDCEIRGELYCSESNFIHLAEQMNRLNLEKPTSPRNIVAGVLGRKHHGELARFFNFFAFDVLGGSSFKTEIEKSTWLGVEHFRLPQVKLLKSSDEIESYLTEVRKVMSEDEVGCDGAVFSFNDLALHEELGNTSHHPRYKMSFKWQGETAQSTIKTIEWATSRLGIVTPVAVIDPVVLSGAKITNITLHNAAHVKTYNLKSGDVIELVRSGEVIPKFLAVIASAKGECALPTKCPSCASLLIADDVRIKCPETLTCPAQKLGSILNWINCVEIEDLSEKRLLAMIELGLVKETRDLYRLSWKDFLALPATKEKMATKLFENIQKTKQLPLARFLNGLGIEGAGLTTWEKIVDEFHSLDVILELTPSDLEAVSGFAAKSAVQIVDGLSARTKMIHQLLEVGVQPVEGKKRGQASQLLADMQFVITGALSKPRAEIEGLIKDHGGKLASSVSKNTSAVITNETDSQSSKMLKAKSLGTPIWTEIDFLNKIASVL